MDISDEDISRLTALATTHLRSLTSHEARMLEPDDLVNTVVLRILEGHVSLNSDLSYAIMDAADKLLGNGLTNRASRTNGLFRETLNNLKRSEGDE